MSYLWNTRPTTVPLPATTGRESSHGRNGDHMVTALGISASGATLTEAREAYLAVLGDMLALRQESPTVARDDDGSVVVTYPCGSGWATVRVSPDDRVSHSYSASPGTRAWRMREIA
jgi:hypothetical protein